VRGKKQLMSVTMIVCPDAQLMNLLLARVALSMKLQSITDCRNRKRQKKRVARRTRLRRDIRAVNRAIAERCHEIFTP
jgi:hypothetical protein